MGEMADWIIEQGELSYWGLDPLYTGQEPLKPKEGDDCIEKNCTGFYIRKTNKKLQVSFLGCSNWPSCKTTTYIL